MRPDSVAEFAALLATALAAVAALPQLRRVIAGDGRGVSLSAALIGVVNETAWVAYAVREQLWSVAPEGALMATCNLVLVVWLLRTGAGGLRRGARAAAVWALAIAGAAVLGGPAALGVALGGAYAVQVAPAVWTAWRTVSPSGVAAVTWAIVLVESTLWGVYGVSHGDPATSMLAAIGTLASVAVLLRKAASRRLSQSTASMART